MGHRRILIMKAEAVDLHHSRHHLPPVEHLDTQVQPAPPPVSTLKAFDLQNRSKCDGTLEGLVRELLHPLLKNWLDQNLAEIVERCVNAEIKRIVTA
jgi:cell pole-organizing protein PopZ